MIAQPHRPPLQDQAAGLRRLFDGRPVALLGVVSNPALPWSGLLLEHLLQALARLGHHPLLLDAAPTAAAPDEWACVDLRWAEVNRLEHHSHIAARGVIARHLDAGRGAQSVLRSAAESAGWADVLVVHAPAEDLGRLMAGRLWQPLVLADTDSEGLMQAYAGLKRLARRRLPPFQLLIESARHPSLGPRMAGRLEASARRFLSWPMQRAVVIHGTPQDDPVANRQLSQLLAQHLQTAPTCQLEPGLQRAAAACGSTH